MKSICIGSVATLAIAYLAAAFVAADFFWLSNIWDWRNGERAFFLYLFCCAVGFGGAAGYGIRHNSPASAYFERGR